MKLYILISRKRSHFISIWIILYISGYLYFFRMLKLFRVIHIKHHVLGGSKRKLVDRELTIFFILPLVTTLYNFIFLVEKSRGVVGFIVLKMYILIFSFPLQASIFPLPLSHYWYFTFSEMVHVDQIKKYQIVLQFRDWEMADSV